MVQVWAQRGPNMEPTYGDNNLAPKARFDGFWWDICALNGLYPVQNADINGQNPMKKAKWSCREAGTSEFLRKGSDPATQSCLCACVFHSVWVFFFRGFHFRKLDHHYPPFCSCHLLQIAEATKSDHSSEAYSRLGLWSWLIAEVTLGSSGPICMTFVLVWQAMEFWRQIHCQAHQAYNYIYLTCILRVSERNNNMPKKRWLYKLLPYPDMFPTKS